MSASTKPKKGSILDLNKYIDKPIKVKFSGGREVHGILKGYDQLVNLVLDETTEQLKDDGMASASATAAAADKPATRSLGLTVCRGTSVMLICPMDGMQEIANPFIQAGQALK